MTEQALEDGVRIQRQRARLARLAVVACILASVAGVVAGAMQRELLIEAIASNAIDPDAATANDNRMTAASRAYLVLLVLAAIAWLRWQHRAYANLLLGGSREAEYTPGWSVGYWFVPFINFIRPYQVTRELWLRSSNGNRLKHLQGEYTPALIGWWWGLWIATGMLSRFVRRLATDDPRLDQLVSLTNYGMAIDVMSAVSGVLAILVIGTIANLQSQLIPAAPAPLPAVQQPAPAGSQ
jgi:hypothetical protein